MTDKATPSPASADSVMAKAMMLVGALDDSCEEATSLPFLEAVTALRAEAERLAAQSAPTVPGLDTLRADFHNWCATNGYKTGFVKGGECPMGGPVYEDHKTHAAWWAFQKATKLYAGAQSAPLAQQAREYPPLPEGVKARFKCEDCDGTGYTGEMIPGGEFQPPEPIGCTSCNFTGWWAECEAYSADQLRAYADATCALRAARVSPAEKTARMLTVTEFNVGRFCLGEDECIAQGIDFSAYERGIADASAAFSRNT